MKTYKLLLWLIVAITVNIACDDDDNGGDNKTNITVDLLVEQRSNSSLYNVEIYSTETPFVGYNTLYFAITNPVTKEYITDAAITLYPEMDMGMMKHTAPTEQPETDVDNPSFYKGAVVFIMPSGDAGSWSIEVAMEINGLQDTAIIDIPIVELPDEPKLYSFVSKADNGKYFISLINPADPMVGLNNFEITVHKKISMMSFPAVNDLTVLMEPVMPSMDHGSPNNIDPTFDEDGHYKGRVNFTMTGWWRVNLQLSRDTTLIADDAYLDISF